MLAKIDFISDYISSAESSSSSGRLKLKLKDSLIDLDSSLLSDGSKFDPESDELTVLIRGGPPYSSLISVVQVEFGEGGDAA